MAGSNFFPRVTSSILCFLALILNASFGFGSAFEISDPTFSWNGFRLNIDYEISESIVAERVTYDLVSDKDCIGGIIDEEEIESELVEVSETKVRISLLMNPESIHASRYVIHQPDYSIVGICSRIWINKPTDTYEPQTANRDDYLLIKADLEDLEGIYDILEDKAKRWGVNVFRCNRNNVKLQSPDPIRNGEKLRLCVKPTQRTLNDGVYLGTMKSFHFERDGVLQKAAETYGTDDVTQVFNCDRGSTMCVVETVLRNEFFHSPGEVKGEAVLFFQWGKVDDDRRQLAAQEQEPRNYLRAVTVNLERVLYDWYEEGEIVAEKTGKEMIDVEPMDKVYSAEAFSCDDNNRPDKQSALNETDTVRICIKPTKEARDVGVYIHNLESFAFALANDDKSQQAIDSFGAVADDRTTLDCSVGAEVCSISSTLNDWFYDEDATMVATGYVVLQFGSQRRRVQATLDSANFAGRDQVEAFFDTIGRNPSTGKGPVRPWFEDLFERYDLSDTHLTILYIVMVVLIVLITLCCCAGCIFFFWYGRRQKEEPVTKMHNINIKINPNGKDISQSQFQDERPDSSQSNTDDDNENDYNTDNNVYPVVAGKPSRRASGSHRAASQSNTESDDIYGYNTEPHPGTLKQSRRASGEHSRRASGSHRAPEGSRRASGSHSRRASGSHRPPESSRRASGSHSRRASGSHRPPESSRRASGEHSRRASGSHRAPESSRRASGSHRAPESSRRASGSHRPPESPKKSSHSRRASGSHRPPESPKKSSRRASGTHSRRGSGSHRTGSQSNTDGDDIYLKSPKTPKKKSSRKNSGKHSRRASGSHSRRASGEHSRRASGEHSRAASEEDSNP